MNMRRITCTSHASSSSTPCVSSYFLLCPHGSSTLQVKTASLRWHSPMLDDISAVSNWVTILDSPVTLLFIGQDLGQGEPGDGENVSRRSLGETPRYPAFPIWFDPRLGRRVPRATRRVTMRTRPFEPRSARSWLGRLLWYTDSIGFCGC